MAFESGIERKLRRGAFGLACTAWRASAGSTAKNGPNTPLIAAKAAAIPPAIRRKSPPRVANGGINCCRIECFRTRLVEMS